MPRRVLVIEDDEDLGEALGDLISSFGHAVTVARTGRSGCELAREFVPDVIFCDLGLPEMDGYKTAEALRADPASARAIIVALTGEPGGLREPSGVKSAFDHRLLKPVVGEVIERIISQGHV